MERFKIDYKISKKCLIIIYKMGVCISNNQLPQTEIKID